MKKLFPEEFKEIRNLLDSERMQVEEEEKRGANEFVPWEPYENTGTDEAPVIAPSHSAPVPTRVPQPDQPALTPVPEPSGKSKADKPKGRSAAVIVTIVLLLLLCGAGAFILIELTSNKAPETPSGPVVESGTLEVKSDPPGARIVINGKFYGKTPSKANGMPLNEDLTLRVETEGYEVFILPVRLTAKQPEQLIEADLKKK